MTIKEAIRRAGEIKPNTVPLRTQLYWLNECEQTIFMQLYCTHKDPPIEEFINYTEDTPDSTVLLAAPPYDRLYVYKLMAEIDLMNNETDRYQNSAALYNQAMLDYSNYWNRTHLPLGERGLHW